jgi:hypothetical protein
MTLEGADGIGNGRGGWPRAGRIPWLALLPLLVAVPANADPEALARLGRESPALTARLLRDGLVVLKDGEPGASSRHPGFVEAYVIFEEPPERVFALLADTRRQAEFRPQLERIETVAELPDGSIEEHHLRVLFSEIAYRLRYRIDPDSRRIDWSLDPGFANDLSRVDGWWKLDEAEGGRTLARFGTRVEVGPAVPAFLARRAASRDVPRTLERCRAWVASNGLVLAALPD